MASPAVDTLQALTAVSRHVCHTKRGEGGQKKRLAPLRAQAGKGTP